VTYPSSVYYSLSLLCFSFPPVPSYQLFPAIFFSPSSCNSLYILYKTPLLVTTPSPPLLSVVFFPILSQMPQALLCEFFSQEVCNFSGLPREFSPLHSALQTLALPPSATLSPRSSVCFPSYVIRLPSRLVPHPLSVIRHTRFRTLHPSETPPVSRKPPGVDVHHRDDSYPG